MSRKLQFALKDLLKRVPALLQDPIPNLGNRVRWIESIQTSLNTVRKELEGL